MPVSAAARRHELVTVSLTTDPQHAGAIIADGDGIPSAFILTAARRLNPALSS